MLKWQIAIFPLTKDEDETNVRTENMILFCHALSGKLSSKSLTEMEKVSIERAHESQLRFLTTKVIFEITKAYKVMKNLNEESKAHGRE